MKVLLPTVPQFRTVPPHRPVDVVEGGGTSEPGRAFSLRLDWAESSRGGGSSGSKKRKTHLFFIVKDAVECDGLISNEPGRWISERKEPRKVSEGRERGKDAAPQGLQHSSRV